MMEELIKPGVNGALWRGHPDSLAQRDPDTTAETRTAEAMGIASPTKTQTHLSAAALPRST